MKKEETLGEEGTVIGTVMVPEEVAEEKKEYYVEPHWKVSREVTPEDMEVIVRDAHIMYNLCHSKRGIYNGGFAVAHCQINDTDPLRFFVTNSKQIIINPKIVNHTKVYVDSKEGCLSYPYEIQKNVKRFNKVTVEHCSVLPDLSGFSPIVIENYSGSEARVFQHELSHMNGHYIFDEGAKPEDCL